MRGIRLFLAMLPLALAGCSVGQPKPAFRAGLPARIPADVAEIAIVGDLQVTPGFVRMMRRRENNREPQRILMADLTSRAGEYGALVIVGDLVFTARSPRAWRHFDSLVAPVAAAQPVLPAIGNHDYHCFFIQLCTQRVVPKQFRARFPWFEPGKPYAVSWGRLQLLFLDSETNLDAQAQWLADALAATDADAALVFFHRPAWSNSIDRGAYGNPDVQRTIVPVLEAHSGTVTVFSGHIHGYEHIVKDGINYLTTAGGGGPRGLLGRDRPDDVYRGRDCRTGETGEVLRPYNYLLLRPVSEAIEIEVRGMCRDDPGVEVLDTVRIPYPGR